jgi:hypothetical protein
VVNFAGSWSGIQTGATEELRGELGVSPTIVGEERKQVSNLDTSEKSVGKDGKAYPARKPSAGAFLFWVAIGRIAFLRCLARQN